MVAQPPPIFLNSFSFASPLFSLMKSQQHSEKIQDVLSAQFFSSSRAEPWKSSCKFVPNSGGVIKKLEVTPKHGRRHSEKPSRQRVCFYHCLRSLIVSSFYLIWPWDFRFTIQNKHSSL